MPKKAGIAILTLGAVLICSALLLFLHYERESDAAQEEAERILPQLESLIQAQTRPLGGALPEGTYEEAEIGGSEPTISEELPVVELEGYPYVGYVEIPALELKLPVLSEWDDEWVNYAPCRHCGSSRTDDLVIAAHNSRAHFRNLKTLTAGDTVYFTDMEGRVNTYAVEKVETLSPYDVDAVLNSDYALVLYTCTLGGKSRIVVFCNRVGESVTR